MTASVAAGMNLDESETSPNLLMMTVTFFFFTVYYIWHLRNVITAERQNVYVLFPISVFLSVPFFYFCSGPCVVSLTYVVSDEHTQMLKKHHALPCTAGPPSAGPGVAGITRWPVINAHTSVCERWSMINTCWSALLKAMECHIIHTDTHLFNILLLLIHL